MAETPYITNYSGQQIDTAISAFMQTKYARRSILSHDILATTWLGDDHDYYINIKLGGIYNIGEYPIIYFLDTNGVRYELDYKMLELSSAAPYIQVRSHVKMAGKIVEITNISSDPLAPVEP